MLGDNFMRTLIRSIALSVALTATQTTSAQTAENQEVLAAVHTLVNAWREPSVAKADAVLHENYRAESWQLSDKGRFVFLETRDHLLGQIATLRPGLWDVRLLHTSLNIDPNGLAVVWAKYVFYSDGRPNHCGYEAYTLIHTPHGWRVINFADTDTPLQGPSRDATCPG
jgi:hypothetical protein